MGYQGAPPSDEQARDISTSMQQPAAESQGIRVTDNLQDLTTEPETHLQGRQADSSVFGHSEHTIGSPEKLKKVGVEPKVDLPGVDLDFQDVRIQFENGYSDPEVQKKVLEEWRITGGPASTNGIEAGVKIRPTEEDSRKWTTGLATSSDQAGTSISRKSPTNQSCIILILAGFFVDHMDVPPGKYFSQFHFLEYPFSRGSTHISSADPYEVPDFDADFMNDERDMAPLVWGYIKSRERSRRMDAYAGELTSHHPFFAYDSPALCQGHGPRNNEGLRTAVGPSLIEKPKDPKAIYLNSSQCTVQVNLPYTKRDIKAIEEWGKQRLYFMSVINTRPVKRHVETTWHSLGTCSIAPNEGNSIVKHGVLDERLNVHGVNGSQVC
ncbi:MAG: hypothetical protein LQ340_003327 [Diploschistes diacapsis]|nr:MAG: hypothetical protein LQ340_003327 [Diploschistes diacapsis]